MKKFFKNWLLAILAMFALIVFVLALFIPVFLFAYLFGKTVGTITFITMIILGFSFIVASEITFNEEGNYFWMKR